MRKKRGNSDYGPVDPTANHYGLTDANFSLLNKLVPWLDEHRKQDAKFKMAVIARLSRAEAMLVQVLGCEVANWILKCNLTEEKEKQFMKEVNGEVETECRELGAKMVKYIYGGASGTGGSATGSEPDGRAVCTAATGKGRRRKWSGWEI